MVTFWERAAYSVNFLFAICLFVILKTSIFVSRTIISVLIVLVSGFTFLSLFSFHLNIDSCSNRGSRIVYT